MKMSIEGKRGERKGRESRGKRWSNVEALQDLRESGHVVGEKKNVWSFLSTEIAKISALRKAVGGKK